ncbi:MAG TPA: hypothetical protein VFA18_20955 [Gemmataceae bacterium]|nr:hypothetical protein [Gemmataceae bacterium]
MNQAQSWTDTDTVGAGGGGGTRLREQLGPWQGPCIGPAALGSGITPVASP